MTSVTFSPVPKWRATPTAVPTEQPTPVPPTGTLPGGDNGHGHVTPADRQAAAARAAAARQAGLLSSEQLTEQAVPSINPGGTPDYFGTTPNYADRPLPASLGIIGDGTGAAGTVTLTAGGEVAGITLTDGGSAYTDAGTIAMVVGGGGTGAILMPVIDPSTGSITSINVVSGGSGYNSVPGIRKFVDFSPGTGYRGH